VVWISGGFLFCECERVSVRFEGGEEEKESRIVKLSFSGA
jgi:hypothetical protein